MCNALMLPPAIYMAYMEGKHGWRCVCVCGGGGGRVIILGGMHIRVLFSSRRELQL